MFVKDYFTKRKKIYSYHISLKQFVKRGLTLMETVLALIIGLLVVGAVVLYYSEAQNNKQAIEIKEEITYINAIVHQLYAGYSDYSQISAEYIIKSGLIPNKYVQGDSIVTPNRKTIQLYGANPFGMGFTGYVMVIYSVDKSVCSFLSTTEWPSIINFQINGHNQGNHAMDGTISQYCSSGPVNNMGWTFY